MKPVEHNVTAANLKAKKPKKEKKPKERTDLRSQFWKLLKALDVEKIKKPWMASKAFKLVTTAAELRAWAEGVIADKSRWKQFGNELRPVVAVDTETVGLDTRILVDVHMLPDGSWELTYEVKTEIAGVCLSSDGIEGLYVPINHEDGKNIDREACREILQWLFDQAHLVFYNAKFDREIMRLCLGIEFRPYPFFEDVQVLQYINDPKADLGDDGGKGKKWTGDSGGLKALSEKVLQIEQIKGETLMKVKADFFVQEKYTKLKSDPANADWPEDKFIKKATSQRMHYAPFTWVPTELALWYAGGDAICTWLLWEKMHPLAFSRRLVHRIDHELIDTLTWLERQRFIVDAAHLQRTVKWHTAKLLSLNAELRELALRDGWKEKANDDGVVLEDDKFNPDSNPQLARFLFTTKGFKVIRMGKEQPSVDAEVQDELRKLYPDDEFLKKLKTYKEYVALHPANLSYDPKDNSARIYLKQNVVAGGRLSGAGGEFAVDGGFGLNPQGIVRVEGNWWVKGNVLDPDTIPVDDIEEYPESALHKSCFKIEEKEKDGVKVKETKKAPGIIKNHIGQYLGYAICLVPECKTCAEKHGILIKNGRLDANQVVNIRSAFVAMKGWTFFCIDYCLSPETRLLTSDLRWKQARDISLGDDLVGVEENLPGRWKRRKFKSSLVEKIQNFVRPCVRITTDKGSWVVSKEHGWLTKKNYKGDNFKWVRSDELKPGFRIARLCDTWEEDTTHGGGYLQGVFDGEGWVSNGQVGFGQKPGLVLEKTKQLLKEKGFAHTDDGPDSFSGTHTVFLNGRNSELRFLGSIRPERLLQKSRQCWENRGQGSQHAISDTVLSIEDVGEQEVIAIKTSTHTFIAEGLLSHNCNIEMRAAANISGEKEFVNEFLYGKGDFHSLTASKVFPEFNDPNVDKARKKFLRSLAKIINFALLYGGTQYTIYENMKAVKKDITFKEAEKMVNDYWAGVPQFAEWCNNKQKIARDSMTCTTTTGRVIDFQSAMEAQGIHKPTKEEMDNYWLHRKMTKAAEAMEKEKRHEDAAKLKVKATALWKDPESGVRNAGDYNRFIGKIQRVAVNVPVQGLCGDFMRIAMNRIRMWATKDPGIAAILRLHSTVHDEIDFQVKNEYAPFVIPRITRLMKLRKYHKTMNWPVGIECDAEYGHSWDVEHHLTGDDSHKPGAWTYIAGMENYIPTEFKDVFEPVLAALTSGVEARAGKAMAWMKENLHPRAMDAYNLEDPTNPRKALTCAFQLHEFWTIDNVPDEDEDKLETLEQYEARVGLTPKDRGIAPEMGWLGAVPQTKVKRPTLQVLGEEIPADQLEITVSGTEIRVEASSSAQAGVTNEEGKVEEDDVFGDVPVRKPTKAVSEEPVTLTPPVKKVEVVPAPDGIPELITMDDTKLRQFQKALGAGRKKVTVRYQNRVFVIPDVGVDSVPEEFILKV